MNKTTRVWLIVAGMLILIGCIIFGGVMGLLKWDFTKLSTFRYLTNQYEVNEVFQNISLKTNTADISFAVTEDNKCTVVCYEQENIRHSVRIQGDTLMVDVVDERRWYEYVGIFAESPKITVYMPAGAYQALTIREDTGDVEIPQAFQFANIDIHTSTGDINNYASVEKSVKLSATTGSIHVEGISTNTLDLSVSTGKVTVTDVDCAEDIKIEVTTGKVNVTNVTCKNIHSDGDTGDIMLDNVIATEKISVERSTGDVNFDHCDAAEVFVETDTGDVKGSLLTDKIFITETDTGKVIIPETTTGGKCSISTDTGDIRINITSE